MKYISRQRKIFENKLENHKFKLTQVITNNKSKSKIINVANMRIIKTYFNLFGSFILLYFIFDAFDQD